MPGPLDSAPPPGAANLSAGCQTSTAAIVISTVAANQAMPLRELLLVLLPFWAPGFSDNQSLGSGSGDLRPLALGM